MKPLRASLMAPVLATLLSGCGGIPPGLEKQWEHRDAAQRAWEGCIYVHPRQPSVCSRLRAEYGVAVEEYETAVSEQRK